MIISRSKDLGIIDFLRSRVPAVPPTPTGSRDAGLLGLWRAGVVAGDTLADAAAEYYGLKRLSCGEVAAHPSAVDTLSRRYLRENYVFPFQIDGVPALVIADPGRGDVLKAAGLALGRTPQAFVASFEDIDRLFDNAPEAASEQLSASSADLSDAPAESLDALQDLARGAPVVRVVDQILERAIETGATDVHFETERDHLRVRLRVDGYLRPDQKLPLAMAPAIISRLKIIAGLDIADRRLPQDGRANLRIGNNEADLRVAVMPTMHGETCVLRILTRDTRLLEFNRVGMGAKDQEKIRALLKEPNGIIIVTGPTGSGKTTTLATAISILNDPARKIVTIEDPVEYQIPGVHQTQLRASIGLTFASALRSFLRHDPDVIMVGEMRDHETASVGVQAALTGHLVLTTLHTNSACDAIIRLSDMGIETYLIGASLRGVIGQRLVRRLCDRCKQPHLNMDPSRRDLLDKHGVGTDAAKGFYQAVGCDACGQTGYRGRVGIFEVLPADDAIRSLIRRKADISEIQHLAQKNGMTLMIEDGLRKCAEGLTSMDEIIRVAG